MRPVESVQVTVFSLVYHKEINHLSLDTLLTIGSWKENKQVEMFSTRLMSWSQLGEYPFGMVLTLSNNSL